MNQMDQYKSEIKNQIQNLVSNNNLSQAQELILEYEKIVKDDVEICSTKAVIEIMKNELDKAEKILIKSINNYGNIFDLTYNLAYVYEQKLDFPKSYSYYSKALSKCENVEIESEIRNTLNNLAKSIDDKENKNNKKVLVIAQIYPPMGGSGVQRTLKFVKYLQEFKWNPIVVTVGKTIFNYLEDTTLENEVPKNVNIIRIDEKENYNEVEIKNLLDKYYNLVRDDELINRYINTINNYQKENNSKAILDALMLPDFSSLWAMDVLNLIDERIDFNEVDAIYSTSGPYSDHIIGYFLKEKYNKPWITDFRDEWTNNPYVNYDTSRTAFKIVRKMEENILSKADKIITTTPLARENYINILNIPSEKIVTITNGYDENDFNKIIINRKKENKFKIMHNGLFYMIRTPETFLKAINNLVHRHEIDKNKIDIIFGYTENREKWEEYLKENDLESIVQFKDYMNHEESIQLAINCDLLLLIIGPGEKNKSVYTGKIFEYLRIGKPILSLSPTESVVEELLYETKSGENFDFYDIKGIESYILKEYNKWQKSSAANFNKNQNIKKYERKHLTKRLSEILDEQFEFRISKKAIKSEDLKIDKQYEKIISNIEESIAENNLSVAENLIKEGLNYYNNDMKLLYMLGNVYFDMKKYYYAYKFYNMAIEKCMNQDLKNKIKMINERIVNNNINSVPQFKRKQKGSFIICGMDIVDEAITLLEPSGYIKAIIKGYSDNIDGLMIDLDYLPQMEYDYIIVLEKDRKKSKEIVEHLKRSHVSEEKIYDFYSYSYPYFIDGFQAKIDNFLKMDKVELLVMGLSYAEVGINIRSLSIPSFNFALSGQDIYYDYYMTKYLLTFESVKNKLKHVCINISYYGFDYDLSLAEQKFIIHRYYFELGQTHHYDNVLHLKLCNNNLRNRDYNNDYYNYHNYKLNKVLSHENIEQEKIIAKRQATMNYPKSVEENIEIFKMNLKMLNENNIKPIIIVLPTSKYYYDNFNNNYQKNKFYSIINELKTLYNFEVLDYFKSDLFEDDDFWDYSHLNKKGAEKFTNILKNNITID